MQRRSSTRGIAKGAKGTKGTALQKAQVEKDQMTVAKLEERITALVAATFADTKMFLCAHGSEMRYESEGLNYTVEFDGAKVEVDFARFVEAQALVAFDEGACAGLISQRVAHALGAASLGNLLGPSAVVTVHADGVAVTRSLIRKLGKTASDVLMRELGPEKLAELMIGEPAVLNELEDGVLATRKLTSVLAYSGMARGDALKRVLESADAQRRARFTFPPEWANELSRENV